MAARRWMLYVVVAFIILAAIAFVALPCFLGRPPGGGPKLAISVGGCAEERVGELTRGHGSVGSVRLRVEGSSLILHHGLRYVCCADISASLYVEDRGDHRLLRIVERNSGEMCRCICDYEIELRVWDLEPGRYKIELYGVEYEGIPAEKLWEGFVEL